MSWYDAVGLVGVAAMCVAYALLQAGRLAPHHPLYSAVNAAGAGLVLVSLWFDFNLSAAVIEGFWLLISVYGMFRAFGRGRTA